MKRSLLLSVICALLLAGCCTSRPAGRMANCDCHRAVVVPDRAFRNFLVENGYAEVYRGKRLKPTEKGCGLVTLECHEQGIGSLQGIEMFPQLRRLTCSDNPLKELDLSVLPNLEQCYCVDVPLQKINLDGCTKLTALWLSHTELRDFDLSQIPNIETFYCIFSPLAEIDVSVCRHLQTLYIRGTLVEEVDITQCPDFKELHALDSRLARIIVTPEQSNSEIKVSVEDSVKIIVANPK